MWLFIWALVIASVHSRPQLHQFDQSRSNVEISKQDILHVTFNASIRDEAAKRKIEENTREILEKIEALNKKQGLIKKKKPSYLHFPFSYSRSQENSGNGYLNTNFPAYFHRNPVLEDIDQEKIIPHEKAPDFKFPTNPFQNPIFQYLENQQNLPTQLKSSTVHSPTGFMNIIQTNPSAQITEDDKIPGEFVQRKITHQQTMIIPNVQTYMNNQYGAEGTPSMQNFQRYDAPIHPALINQFISNSPIANQKQQIRTQNNKVSTLEKQTVNNIKNIIWNSQSPTPYVYPYVPNIESRYQPIYVIPQISNYGKIQTGTNENQAPAILFGPYVVPNFGSALPRQFQSPLQNYFPMVIKDPLVQLFNAFTTMVEYGPQAASSTSGCKTQNTVKTDENSNDTEESDSSQKLQTQSSELDKKQIGVGRYTYDTNDLSNGYNVTDITDKGNLTLILESTELQGNENDSTINIRHPKGKVQEKLYIKDINSGTESNLKLLSQTSNLQIKEDHVKQSRPYVKINQRPFANEASSVKLELAENILRRGNHPPLRDQISNDSEDENEKKIGLGSTLGEDVQVSHDGNKKLFSKDNTGSGIFIHKLKVRRGGVAIAGPGGIATAGEGGTAIVGPNGYAYTQPDSLAIAGTGTKVIAVEPTVNLSELVKNNKTRLGGLHPQRIGKLVAVGPVIYYNKG